MPRKSQKRVEEEKLIAKFAAEVLARDNYTCRRCMDPKQTPVSAHHVVPRARKRGDPRLHRPSNGRTLCVGCHNLVHFAPKCPDRALWIRSSFDE